MQIGLIIGEASPLTWERWRHVVALTERLGFPSLFRSDHFYNGRQKDAIDVYLSFVLAATETTTLRFGPLVSPITFRHPVHYGRMAQQLDALSGGRFVMGLGAGWFDAEHRVYGLDFPAPKERYDRLDDALELLRKLWQQTDAHHDGPYYRLDGADSQPHPPAGRPPVLIGGTGPIRTLRTVARYADEWNSTHLLPADYADRVSALERHCERIGRDPATIRRSMLIFATCGPDDRMRQLAGERFIDMVAPGSGMTAADLREDAGRPRAFTGSTEQLVDRIGQLAALGVTEVVFEHFVTEHDDIPTWIAEELVPRVRNL